MRDASSASPPGSSSALNVADGAAGSTATSSSLPSPPSVAPPPPQPPRCLCLNCSNPMVIYEPDQQQPNKDDVDHLEDETHTRNLMEFIANSAVPMQAPVCKDCADALQSGMKRQLEMLEDDCIKYDKLIESLKKHANVNVADYKAKIEKLKRHETELSAELRALILEEEKVERELAAEKRALEQTTEEEEELWAKLRDFHTYMITNDQDVREINMEIRYIESQLRMLSTASVLSLAFPIELYVKSPSSLSIGVINGFKLGRLPDLQIDWPEINAAWGQALLLLDILMKRAHCALPGVEFVTLHAASLIRVQRGTAFKEYPLYASGGWKPFGNKNMDGGAAIFMDGLALLCKTISEQIQAEGGVPIEWPHRMRLDKIIDNDMEYTVKMQFNAEERWTRAMRAMLINLKWAAATINIEKA